MFKKNNKRWFNKLSKWGQFLIILIETKKQLSNTAGMINVADIVANGKTTDLRPKKTWKLLNEDHDIMKAYQILMTKRSYIESRIEKGISLIKDKFTQEDLKFLKKASFEDIIELLEEIE